MRTEQYNYIATTFADYVSVRDYRKPLLIVSSEKSTFAYETLAQQAENDGLPHVCALLIGEDGNLHEHVLIAESGSPYVRDALRLIDDARCERKSRAEVQLRLGLLLGYSASECIEFIASETGRTCKCDCCGGPATALPVTDGNPGRFTDNAFTY